MSEETTEGFDIKKAIGLSAAAKMMHGKRGRPPNVETVRRWAKPERGCVTEGGVVVLRSVRYHGEILTMPEWVQQFEEQRLRLGARGMKGVAS